ncbi:DBF4-type zinc finger-containing protein 2 [Synchiropus picturatus]
MCTESHLGPPRSAAGGRGYCSCCKVLYNNLAQHLTSLRHLDSVQASSRGSSCSSACSSQTKRTLMERFLQDVLEHHPHLYHDPRPPHADLPLASPPLPQKEMVLQHMAGDNSPREGEPMEKQSEPARDQGPRRAATLSVSQTTPKLPAKAQRKTNRTYSKKAPFSTFSSGSPCPFIAQESAPGPSCGPGPKHRRDVWKELLLLTDEPDSVDQTIEEVIQTYCYSDGSTSCQWVETESFHLSIAVSLESLSDDWDTTGQIISSSHLAGCDSPVKARLDISLLMDVQVDLEDQVYTKHLDSALHGRDLTGSRVRQEPSFLTIPIERVFPLPKHFPDSFRGKSWAQIEREDEEKITRMIQQFRRQQFVCYFDSESLARYGKHRHKKMEAVDYQELDPEPSLDEEDRPLVVRRKKRLKSFRLASRCQVVKISHATQTTSVPQAKHHTEERPSSLPPSYSNVIMPLQPNTSLLYLLHSPERSTPSLPPASGLVAKQSRKRRHPQDLQGLQLKYKPLPFQFYDLKNNCILPQGAAQSTQIQPSGTELFTTPSPTPSQRTLLPCDRQLFRSPSPTHSHQTLQPCVRRLFTSPSPKSQQLPT